MPSQENYLVGRNPVLEALKAGREINKAWLLERQPGRGRDQRLQKIEKLLQEAGVIINYSPRAALDKLSPDLPHQGIVVQLAAQDYADARQLLTAWQDQGKAGFILILDEIQDGHNLGACLRVAEGAAIDLVVIPERRSASLDQFVAKSAAGALEYVPVAREVNLTRFVLDLKDQGYWIYGAAGEGAADYSQVDYQGKIALIIGNEGKGISPKLRGHCDFLVKIPMWGQLNSLNASVACGIIAFEAARRRHQAAGKQDSSSSAPSKTQLEGSGNHA